MTPEIFLNEFKHLADAPGGVTCLREVVLQLAVQGKLVSQNAHDEPGSALIERIAEEKEALIRAGEVRRYSSPSSIPEEPNIDSIPNGWCWALLGDATHVEMGQSPPSTTYNESRQGLPFYQGKADFGRLNPTPKKWCTSPKKVAQSGDVLISVRAPVGPTNLSLEQCCIGRGLAAIRPLGGIDSMYLLHCLRAFAEVLASKGVGSTFAAVSRKVISSLVLPIPPVAEQKRIVAKIDELMALCDDLEARQVESRRVQLNLCQSALQRLGDANNPTERARNWSFVHNAFPDLLHRPENIRELRKTILQLAVTGHLVPQNPNDEPASGTVQAITERKESLVVAGKVKRSKGHKFSSQKELFPVPGGWKSIALSDLVEIINGRAYKRDELLDSGTPVLRVGNLFTSDKWYYSDLELESKKYCDAGDLIYAWSASFGPFIWPGPRAIYHYHIWKLAPHAPEFVNKQYLLLFLQHETEAIKEGGHGISMIHMTKQKMERVTVPFPPLAEQKRIVAKVDELIHLCDRLEQQLTEAETTAQTLATTATATFITAGRTASAGGDADAEVSI